MIGAFHGAIKLLHISVGGFAEQLLISPYPIAMEIFEFIMSTGYSHKMFTDRWPWWKVGI